MLRFGTNPSNSFAQLTAVSALLAPNQEYVATVDKNQPQNHTATITEGVGGVRGNGVAAIDNAEARVLVRWFDAAYVLDITAEQAVF